MFDVRRNNSQTADKRLQPYGAIRKRGRGPDKEDWKVENSRRARFPERPRSAGPRNALLVRYERFSPAILLDFRSFW